MGQSHIRLIDGERYRQCGKCGEYWPDTEAFFYKNTKGDGFRSPCKACIAEKKQLTGSIKPCCVEGCDKPRYQRKSGTWDSRCAEHRYHIAVAKPRKERLKLEGKSA